MKRFVNYYFNIPIFNLFLSQMGNIYIYMYNLNGLCYYSVNDFFMYFSEGNISTDLNLTCQNKNGSSSDSSNQGHSHHIW